MVKISCRVSRRWFAGGGAAIAALALARLAEDVDFGLLGLIGDDLEARRLAAWHLARDPSARARIDSLKREITSPHALRRHADAAKKADLRAGRVAIVDGWVLARSEADLLAAIAFG